MPQLSAQKLSAIIITRNEAANIGECLDGLAFCDERIVVDCGSADATADIARGKGARVEQHEWHGFGPQKNFALSLATGDWVLSIDADERVTPELAQAIKAAMADAGADGFELPRVSSFCGRPMRHSGWYPDYVLRLFRRGKGRFDDALVHERVICDGTVKRLDKPLIHHPVLKLEDALSRMDRYSTASARRWPRQAEKSLSSPALPTGFSPSCAATCCASAFSTARKVFCSRSPMPRAAITAT